jgi:hypothetical protein
LASFKSNGAFLYCAKDADKRRLSRDLSALILYLDCFVVLANQMALQNGCLLGPHMVGILKDVSSV